MARRKFKMRDRVKCNVTGFEGVITAYSEYLNGCEQYCVKPTELTDGGKMREGVWFDQDQLDKVKTAPKSKEPERTGGPQMDSLPPC